MKVAPFVFITVAGILTTGACVHSITSEIIAVLVVLALSAIFGGLMALAILEPPEGH